MSAQKRILFVSHDATRNGATILLLDFLHWLKDNSDHQFDVLVNGRGELLDQFRSICRTIVWRNPDKVFAPVPQAVRSDLESKLLMLQMWGRRSYDLLYLNTASTASHLPVLALRASSVLWHIHELEYALRKSISDKMIDRLFKLATRFMVVSQSARETLVETFKIQPAKVDLVHGFVSLPTASAAEVQSIRRRVREDLEWPQDAFVVGGCGTLGWRKGTDVFLQIAEILMKSDRDGQTRFLWVGGGSVDERLRFAHDVRLLGLQDRCRCIAATSDVKDYYHAMDVFALPSREDPFPLVMLEAGARNLPVVCFAGSGGGQEFVDNEAGFTVPYLDISGFARCVVHLRDSPELCRKFGAAAAKRVARQHLVNTQAPKMLESIERCLSESSVSRD